MKRLLNSLLVVFLSLGFVSPAWSQQNMSFPFNEVQELTPQEHRIQKYKMQRLRIQQVRQEWQIIRGINEKIDDLTLLKMVGATEQLNEFNSNQLIGNSVALGGLALAAGGGLIMTNVVPFDGSLLVGIGMLIAGVALTIGGEFYATNMLDLSGHIIDRKTAETYVKEYNTELKRELNLDPALELD